MGEFVKAFDLLNGVIIKRQVRELSERVQTLNLLYLIKTEIEPGQIDKMVQIHYDLNDIII